MTDKESQAHDLVRNKEWHSAVQIYDQILSPTTNNFKTPKERIIGCLVGRTECYMELKNYESAITDCRRLLKMLNEVDVCSTSARIRRRLIHALYKLKRFQDAETACREWINAICGPQNNSDMSKVLERYRTVIQIANGQKSNQRISIQRLDEEMTTLDNKLETWATHNLPQDRFSRITKQFPNSNSAGTGTITTTTTTAPLVPSTTNSKKHVNEIGQIGVTSINSNISGNVSSTAAINSPTSSTESPKILSKDKLVDIQFQKQIEQINSLKLNNGSGGNGSGVIDMDNQIACTYCSINFTDRLELRAHCQTESHQNVIMSDEGEICILV